MLRTKTKNNKKHPSITGINSKNLNIKTPKKKHLKIVVTNHQNGLNSKARTSSQPVYTSG